MSKPKSVVCSSEQMLRHKFFAGVWAVSWEMTVYHSFLSFVWLLKILITGKQQKLK